MSNDRVEKDFQRFCNEYPEGDRIRFDYRYLLPRPIQGAFRVTAQRLDDKGRQIVSDLSLELTPFVQDPWVWRFQYSVPGGLGKLRVIVNYEGKDQLTDDIPVGSLLNQPTDNDQFREAPRLVKCLNTTPVYQKPYNLAEYEDPGIPQLQAVINRIWERLQGGLDSAWMGVDGSRGLPADAFLSEDSVLSERWSRAVAEMLTCCSYNQPSTMYRHLSDAMLATAYPGRNCPGQDGQAYIGFVADGRNDPVYPVMVECQHQVTLALLARGYPIQMLQNAGTTGTTAGAGTGGLPVFNTAGGHWHKTSDKGVKAALTTLSPPVTPGSVYVYQAPGQGNKGGAHIGIIIRTHGEKANNRAWLGLQSFDTSGMNAPGRSNGQPEGMTGLGDDPWVQKQVGAPATTPETPLVGIGVPASADHFAAGIALANRARPLAFGRLVLSRRLEKNQRELLYASPLLHLYHGERRFSLPALIWSLRGQIGREHVEAGWCIDIPREEPKLRLATHLLVDGRTHTVAELLTDSTYPPNKELPENLCLGMNYIYCSESGQVRQLNHFSHNNSPPKDAQGNPQPGKLRPGIFKHLPWGRTTLGAKYKNAGAVTELNAGLPPYFGGTKAE